MRRPRLPLLFAALGIVLVAGLAAREFLREPAAPAPGPLPSTEGGPPARGESPKPWLRGRADAASPAGEAAKEASPGPGTAPEPVPAGGLLVEVRGPNGTKVSGGWVRATVRQGGRVSSTLVPVENGRGHVRDEDLDPGGNARVWIEVTGPKGSPLAGQRVGPLTALPDRPLLVTLEIGVEIAGCVLDAEGVGVEGAEAMLRTEPAGPGSRGPSLSRETTGRDGTFRIPGLSANERYVLVVRVPPKFDAVEARSVRGGETDLRIVATRLPMAKVKVLDWEGEPVSGASVRTASREPEVPESVWDFAERGITDSNGDATLFGLRPGEAYALAVLPPYDRDDLQVTRIDEWHVVNTTVRLGRARAIEGIVEDATGRRVGQAEILAEWENDNTVRTAHTNEDGTFRVAGLPDGEIRLFVTKARGYDVPVGEEWVTVAEAGARGVVVRCDLGLELTFRVRYWEPVRGLVRAELIDESEKRIVSHAFVNEDGRVRIGRATRDATYALWIHDLKKERYVLESGLRAGGPERVVAFRPGGTMTGRIFHPGLVEPTGLTLWAESDGLRVFTQIAGDGSFAFRGIPDLPWKLTAFETGETFHFRGDAEGRVGQHVEFTVRKVRKE